MRPRRGAPIAIFRRDDRDWLLPLADGEDDRGAEGPLSALAVDVEAMLGRRGALFASELARERNCTVRSIEDALWELVADGRVTADGFENLRTLLTPAARRRPFDKAQGRPFDRAQGRHSRRSQFAAGRWSLVGAGSAPQGDRVEAIARQVLRRWGVVFRDLLAREVIAPAWRDLLVVFRRLEARGEVRGGRFVSGFVGEQFALPEAVELLREVRRSGAGTDAVTVASADPLNLAGIILPGPRVPAQAKVSVAIG
ncbi:MAG: hypothetical protein HYZ58_16350 [Acidobacteria bacterium]|nr:hypothetical protein [Acidobacteriota bacterium]